MSSFASMPSTSSVFSAYTQCAAYFMLSKSIADQTISVVQQYIPERIRTYILSKYESFFIQSHISTLTIVIDEKEGYCNNQVYDASKAYLRTIISPSVDRLRVSKVGNQKSILVTFVEDAVIMDNFEGIEITWKLTSSKEETSTKQWFELSFEKRYQEKVLGSYLPYVLDRAEAIEEQNKVVTLHSNGDWDFEPIDLDHPSTFDTLAMDPGAKKALINDLDMFLTRKEFYKRVGKAWKRGYLLYGPPGTGKSSLIAAMANYLRFHIYTIELNSVCSDSDLRRLLVRTENKSMIVIEDIDCGRKFQNREDSSDNEDSTHDDKKVTLSGLLNFIDGLWSSCGEQRIIVFTTNYKDRLDPALLRPGRMDVHIYMGYCNPAAFNVLANNYLSIQDHPLFGKIHGLIENVNVTPAEIAEELMKSNRADTALEGLAQALLQKQIEKDTDKDEEVKKDTVKVEKEEDKQEKDVHKKKKKTALWRKILRLKRK